MAARSLFDLSGRVALVTGASSGIGRHLAKVLAANGAAVAVAARRVSRLDSLCEEITQSGGKAVPYTLDVTETKRISPTLNAIEAEFGAPVDLLLNNAGMSREGRLLDAGEDTFDEVMQTNTRAPFFMAQAVARRLVETKREGSIINVASLIVLRPNAGIGVYGMSKASVDFMTRAMAKEWSRHGIRVNALLPGYIETEMNQQFFQSEPGVKFTQLMPRRRIGKLSDLDGPTLLLASEAGSGMTGASILVDDCQLHGKF